MNEPKGSGVKKPPRLLSGAGKLSRKTIDPALAAGYNGNPRKNVRGREL